MLASAMVVAGAIGAIQGISLHSGSAAAQGQSSAGGTTKWTVARTAWGDPDLQGKWAVVETGTPMERPKEFANREFLTDKELADRIAALSKQAPADDGDDAAFPALKKTAPAHEKGIRGEEYNRFWVDAGPARVTPWKRTSLVIDPPDGQVPPLTPEAVKRLEAREAARRGRGEADGWEDRNLSERCLLTAFVRFAGGGTGSIRQLVQAPGQVVIIVATLNSNEPIVIPLDGRPRPGENVRNWLGISRGHWEGSTLVVETTQLKGEQDGGPVMPSRLPFGMPGGSHLGPGDTVRLTERFTRVGPDTIEYSYTIDDPKTYVRPYTVLRPLTRQADDFLMPENGCHEGNYGIVGQLSAGRADEAYALQAAKAEAEGRQSQIQEMKRKTDEWMKSHQR
jgi:hypothetical protein